MANNKKIAIGPVAMANAAGNLFNTKTTAGGVNAGGIGNTYTLLTRIRIVNVTGAPVAFSLFIGATGASAAGTEFLGSASVIAANSAFEWFGNKRLEPADFLTGFAGAAASLTFEADAEVGII